MKMTDQQKIQILEQQVNKLNIQMDRVLSLLEQQYTAMDLLQGNQKLITDKLFDMDRSVRANEQYIAGQICRNDGR